MLHEGYHTPAAARSREFQDHRPVFSWRIRSIDRGYERVDQELRRLGADIVREE